MNFHYFTSIALTLFVISNATFALPLSQPVAAPNNQAPAKELIVKTDKIYDPNILSIDSIQSYEPKFDFDWNNYSTIETNRKRIAEVETFLKTDHDFSKLSSDEQQSLGRILYKLGTFYTHIMRQPNLAIEIMSTADKFLKTRQDKAWNYDHLAFAYEQRFFRTRKLQDNKKGFYYTNRVIADLYRNARNKEVAFAHCVQGLLHNDAKNYGLAETSFKTALLMYEKIPGGKDDQYIRAKNRFANIILEMNGNDLRAINIFQEVRNYWLKKPHYNQNPYAAKNLISLGQAYIKIGNYKEGAEEIEKSIYIYQNVYGKKSELLAKPFRLLADAYKKLDNEPLAEACERKAKQMHPPNYTPTNSTS